MALFQAVWQRRFDPGTNVVAVNMSRLRAKVDHGLARPLIHTVDGAYMLSDRLP
jgi:two-component system OmpR family response regulator